MVCFNFLSSGKICSGGIRNDCKLEGEGNNILTDKSRFNGQFPVFEVRLVRVERIDNSLEVSRQDECPASTVLFYPCRFHTVCNSCNKSVYNLHRISFR